MASLSANYVPAACTVQERGGVSHLHLTGAWSVQCLAPVMQSFRARGAGLQPSVVIHLEDISRLDTAGALLINEVAAFLRNRGTRVSIENTNKRYAILLETSLPSRMEDEKDRGEGFFVSPMVLLEKLGKATVEKTQTFGAIMDFFGRFLCMLGTLLVHPTRIRWVSLFFFMDQVGVRAIPIVSLLAFLIGLVVAYMGLMELANLGVKLMAIKLVEVSIFRELGVIITAIVVAGRSSSSFTAQIGSMVAQEEVAAMRSMGLDPLQILVVPRVVSLVLTLPLLVFIANVMGILGGALAICLSIDLSFTGYIENVYAGAKLWNFLVGLIKAPFCALAIGIVGCYQGFQASGSAESVGFLTTISVVQSIFLVIVIDAIFALFFAVLRI